MERKYSVYYNMRAAAGSLMEVTNYSAILSCLSDCTQTTGCHSVNAKLLGEDLYRCEFYSTSVDINKLIYENDTSYIGKLLFTYIGVEVLTLKQIN